ncbi:hypothetical protein D9758_003368 [Tetrapyrgos nigripes]|uniref:Uncharacterized protein n=1 Tax=Tetrapyrgos nigripes TaxID=182062 RepID=A0A8H5GV33_9AGAR|nr:hypothetical protein D9758_003368 [Tetrapyrgos nigripes]
MPKGRDDGIPFLRSLIVQVCDRIFDNVSNDSALLLPDPGDILAMVESGMSSPGKRLVSPNRYSSLSIKADLNDRPTLVDRGLGTVAADLWSLKKDGVEGVLDLTCLRPKVDSYEYKRTFHWRYAWAYGWVLFGKFQLLDRIFLTRQI